MTDDLTFASAGLAGVHYARCWPCMLGSHYSTPTWHSWAGPKDIAHASATGQPDPSTQRCACLCVDTRDFCWHCADDEPEPDVMSLDADPCAVCGEAGACSYDDEGRPLIHTTPTDEEQS